MRCCRSGNHFLDDVPVDVGQAAVDAVVVVGQALVVESKQVQYGGVKVVHGGDVLFGLPTEGVGGSVGEGSLDPGSR